MYHDLSMYFLVGKFWKPFFSEIARIGIPPNQGSQVEMIQIEDHQG